MKHRSPPGPEEAPARPRSRRALSAEERALWDAVARSTSPLKPRQRKPRPEAAAATPAVEAVPAPAPKVIAPLPSGEPAAAPRPKAMPPLVALGRRERSQLSRGRKDIDARLDLHGMTQARAHRALLGFLQRAAEDGMTFVLVITGKGRAGASAASERGVLRRQVPEWLSQAEFRHYVVGFEEAHIGHGGGGALYVRVRRRAVR
ncbi:MAG: Smr/MutS family protein [Xanthobacteraceae bacterium]|nr:Smr/MutS family protein [Xanthobacteraceae bacterium]